MPRRWGIHVIHAWLCPDICPCTEAPECLVLRGFAVLIVSPNQVHLAVGLRVLALAGGSSTVRVASWRGAGRGPPFSGFTTTAVRLQLQTMVDVSHHEHWCIICKCCHVSPQTTSFDLARMTIARVRLSQLKYPPPLHPKQLWTSLAED